MNTDWVYKIGLFDTKKACLREFINQKSEIMYRRKSTDRWNNRIQIATLLIFITFSAVAICGVVAIIGEINKLTKIQLELIQHITGKPSIEETSGLSKQDSNTAYVSYEDFIRHQKENGKEKNHTD